jgi:Phospholipase_D-nuclease N-terminal
VSPQAARGVARPAGASEEPPMAGVETGGLFALLILIADLWAVANVLGSRASLPGKVLWVLAILVLPLLGLLVWLVAGPRASHAGP